MHQVVAGEKCWEAWGTFWTETDHSIAVLITRRKEGKRKEVADAPPFGDGKDLCSVRPALVLFRRQLCGDFWERGRNEYGLFWVLWCYLGRTWKLNGSSAVLSHYVSLRNMVVTPSLFAMLWCFTVAECRDAFSTRRVFEACNSTCSFLALSSAVQSLDALSMCGVLEPFTSVYCLGALCICSISGSFTRG